MTIQSLIARYTTGAYTPVDAVQEALALIAQKDGEIHAFLEVYEDALKEAQEATALYAKGETAGKPLLGVPFAIKNNILIKGKKATAGSKMLENYTATYDATVIARLKDAGAILIGATNLDEFAMGSSTENSAFGPTKNPIDPTRVPGGTSGGSAAAVAMGAVPVALGTDTGGSIRQPASFCGIVGFKPTYGAVSRYGLIASGSSLDQAGALGNTVADTETVFNVIAGPDEKDATTIAPDTYPKVALKEKYTIGIPQQFLGEGVDPDVKAVFDAHVEFLKKEGHTIVDVELPLFEKGLSAYYIVQPAEVSSNLARYDGMRYGLHVEGETLLDDYELTRAEGFGPETKRRILLGTFVLSSGYYDAYYAKAEAVRGLMRVELAEVFKKVDTILIPTSPIPAFTFGEKSDPLSMYKADIFTVPVSLAGVPAISIPGGTVQRDGTALPVGVQYIAPHGGDARLFDIGKKVYDAHKEGE